MTSNIGKKKESRFYCLQNNVFKHSEMKNASIVYNGLLS